MKVLNTSAHRLSPGLPELWVIFAHPDDEALFFYQAIKWLRPKRLKLVCVETDLGADTAIRLQELTQSAHTLGGELTMLGLSSNGEKHIDQERLTQAVLALPHPDGVPILTHGVMGEYGHPGHVDVFQAVYRQFGEDVWTISGPLDADITLSPSEAELAAQLEWVSSIYKSQETVWQWSPIEIRLSHIASSPFGGVLAGTEKQPDLTEAFLRKIKGAYGKTPTDFPPSARQVARHWKLPQLRGRLDGRIAAWEAMKNY